jgi:two-component system LytT family sensor kinase
MEKLRKSIILSLIIGAVIFGIGNAMSPNGFNFKNVNELLINFGLYQLYSFVLGFSNMYFFDYMNSRSWKKEDTIKRSIIGILSSTVITLIGLFFLRAFTSVAFNGRSFHDFIVNEKFRYYQFGLWITLTIVIIFHFIYYYNKYQQNRIKEQKVIAGTASAKFDALKNQLDPHFLFNSLNVLTSLIEENPENAQKFTTSLSKVYRYVLEQKNKELVFVDEELAFAKTYMSLLKTVSFLTFLIKRTIQKVK